MTPRRWTFIVALGSSLLLSGCRHCCKRPDCAPLTTGGPPGPSFNPNLPPQNIPLDAPPRAAMRPEVLLPSPVPPAQASYTPAPVPARNRVILGDPDFNPPAAAVEEKKPAAVKTPPPPAAVDEGSPWPVGIASFAQVKEGVSAGMRPDLDGLDWLQSKGYKTVLFLRSGKEDDSSDRKQVENRGLKYQSLTVTSETISPALVTDFNRIVDEADNRSVFVYDLDGKRAGAMWYLYFRTSEMLKDEEALVRASRFGLKEKGDAEQTQLWTAVQKYLKERTPTP